MGDTTIEWAQKTWNPITGCTKISPGCQNCYAERMARRLAGRYGYHQDGWYCITCMDYYDESGDCPVCDGGLVRTKPFDVTLHPDRLEQPLQWKKPRRVFVCSMGDLFHEDVPFRSIERVFLSMAQPHIYLALTKRPERMLEFIRWEEDRRHDRFDNLWPNVWGLVSIENQETADERIPELLRAPFTVRGVSAEPMLGPVDFTTWMSKTEDDEEWADVLYGAYGRRSPISWIIIGCESGPNRRPMKIEWAVDLVQQCQAAQVPVFVKALDIGGKVSKDPKEWPIDLRVREFPDGR